MTNSDIGNVSGGEEQCQKPAKTGPWGLPLECPACGFMASDDAPVHPITCAFGLSLERVESSNIWGLRYIPHRNNIEGSLYVGFKVKGDEAASSVYRYDGVTIAEAGGIVAAESAGKFFYAFRKDFEGRGGEALKVWERNEGGQ